MNGLDIKMARIRARIKGYELAAMVGITPDKMSRIEVGRIIPDPELSVKIRQSLKIQ